MIKIKTSYIKENELESSLMIYQDITFDLLGSMIVESEVCHKMSLSMS